MWGFSPTAKVVRENALPMWFATTSEENRSCHASRFRFSGVLHHPLDMLHMDLCRPMRVESLACKKYMLVLVDKYSRYTWLEFLIPKSDVADLII
ncbi:hypothetical protein OSB04_012226 [Centaurea solstitialis]|uniref:Integrase catalytic domain-containing protein n=1 Tax=Centaurea solstitialis TaxID=347529 RepID=A0AA38WEE8_9ASTR|nr:hypothetical protein OSB04_012226 [Centaurea solstitialis]